MTSRERWQGWLEVLDAPNGHGIIPTGVTERQRDIMRRLARTLIHFSKQTASAEHESDWARFINKLKAYTCTKGLTDECHLALVTDWAKQEYRVSTRTHLPADMCSLTLRFQASRAWRASHPARMADLGACSVPHDKSIEARDGVMAVRNTVNEDGCLSDVPTLETISESGYGST